MPGKKAVDVVHKTLPASTLLRNYCQRSLMGRMWNLEKTGGRRSQTEGDGTSQTKSGVISPSSSYLLEDAKNLGPSTSGKPFLSLKKKTTSRSTEHWLESEPSGKRTFSTSSAQEQTTLKTPENSTESRDSFVNLLQHLPDSLLTYNMLEDREEYMSKLQTLLSQLGVDGEDLKELMLRALIHEAYYVERLVHEGETKLMMRSAHTTVRSHLEKLGDSVLSLAVVTELAGQEVLLDSGATADVKSEMVSNRCLADAVAARLQLKDLVLLGRSWQHNEMAERNAMADAVERIIGAIYATKGITTALDVLRQKMLPSILEYVAVLSSSKSPVTILQERALAKFKMLPVYEFEVIGLGLDGTTVLHKAHVSISKRMLGEGYGHSHAHTRRVVAEQALRSPIWDEAPLTTTTTTSNDG